MDYSCTFSSISQLLLSFFSSITFLFVLFILWILKLPKILRRKSLKCYVYLKGLLRNIFPKFKIISFHQELFISKFFFSYKKTLFLTHLPLSRLSIQFRSCCPCVPVLLSKLKEIDFPPVFINFFYFFLKIRQLVKINMLIFIF